MKNMNLTKRLLFEFKRGTQLLYISLKLIRLSFFSVGGKKKRLFIDCGSNLGQGYSFFSRFLSPRNYDAILVEPNPHCMKVLKNKFGHQKNLEFRQSAAWVGNQTLKLYGLVEDSQGVISVGASVIANHNSRFYASDADSAIEVSAFSLSELIVEKSRDYDEIILKLDIESSEYEVLNDLIESKACQCIKHIFVEFHSHFFKASDRARYRQMQADLVKGLKSLSVGITIWG